MNMSELRILEDFHKIVMDKLTMAKLMEKNVPPTIEELSSLLYLKEYYGYFGIENKNFIQECFEYIHRNFDFDSGDNSFINGLSGFGFAASILSESNSIAVPTNYFDDLDNHLLKLCFKNDNYDLFYGTLGYAQYFMTRNSNQNIMNRGLATIYSNLRQTANITTHGIYWQNYGEKQNGTIDLSGSHGLTSIGMYLIKHYQLINGNRTILKILSGIVDYILSKTEFNDGDALIPDYLEGGSKYYSPLRWCHGQLSITLFLAKVNQILKRTDLQIVINKSIVYLTKQRGIDECNLNQSGLCHGSMGVAIVFNEIAKITCINSAYDASRYWFKVTINQIVKLKDNSHNTHGLYEGIEGVGLGVLYFLNGRRNPCLNALLL
jgi:hypothetical protein